MINYFTELISVTVALAMGFPIMLYPLWNSNASARLKRAVIVCIAAYAALMCVSLYIARQHIEMDINTINTFKLCLVVPQVIPPLIINRKRIWQALFLMFIWLMYGPIQTGIGNYFAEIWFPHNHALYSSLIIIGVIIITSPLLLYMLRRVCRNPGAGQAKTFWRWAWVVPATFYALIVVQGSYISGSGFGIWFIAVRVVSYIMTLLVCYLFDTVIRQITEAEAVKKEIAFYRKMSHSMRTPLTVISTNIQTAKRRPEEASELLTESQPEIMKMADMIDEALADYDEGAGEA